MKCFIIQIDPTRDDSYSLDAFIRLVRAHGKFPEVEPDYERPSLTNLNFFTEQPQQYWHDLNARVLQHPDCAAWINKVAIIACEGEHGWDDALLLAHYDNNETLDTL